MTTPSGDAVPAFLEGSDALEWFVQRSSGGTILDTHLTVLRDIFGPDVVVVPRAAIDPLSGEPVVLVLGLIGSPDDNDSWERLLEVQQRLLYYEKDLRTRLSVPAPYGRIVVSLGGTPTDWDSLVRNAEVDE